MENGIIRSGLYIVCVFAAVCLGSPISEQLSNQGRSCTLACLKRKLDPVCGSDGRTYKNPCMLNAQNCGSPTKVVEELYEGVCSAEPTEQRCKKINNKSVHCPDKIDPLCGEDTHTYLNYCELLKQNCEQKIGIGVVHRGACDAEHKGEPTTPKPTTMEPITGATIANSESKADESSASVGDTDVTIESRVIHDTTIATYI